MELEKIVVRSLGGEAYVRWMVGQRGRIAYITNEEGRQAAREGRDPDVVIGFPKRDVFVPPTGRQVKDGDEPQWSEFESRFP